MMLRPEYSIRFWGEKARLIFFERLLIDASLPLGPASEDTTDHLVGDDRAQDQGHE